jgi:hypothetical protein
MKNKNQNIPDKKITDLNIQRIKKNVIEETDPDYREEVEDFLKKYRDDTLTGL